MVIAGLIIFRNTYELSCNSPWFPNEILLEIFERKKGRHQHQGDIIQFWVLACTVYWMPGAERGTARSRQIFASTFQIVNYPRTVRKNPMIVSKQESHSKDGIFPHCISSAVLNNL